MAARRLFFWRIPVIAVTTVALAPLAPARAEDLRQLIQVGATRPIATIAVASTLAGDGAVIEVDAGDYPNDVAVFTQKDLTLRAVGGRVKITALGASAEGKGIWVVRGGRVSVEGFDFSGASVPDHNGAGIRFESGHLIVRNSTFTNNENGILTSNDKNAVLEIEHCEFGNNGFGDGYSHDLYVGAIKRLTVTGSYFHHARVGHLLKTRAAENRVFYNRLTDEVGGRASYELEFPNGGLAYVIGNLIQQGAMTENPIMVSYGAEGYRWPKNRLYLVNNTLIDDRPKPGEFLSVRAGQPGQIRVQAVNNLLVGTGELRARTSGEYRRNVAADWTDFVLPQREDYRLREDSRLVGTATEPGMAKDNAGIELRPTREYVHPRRTRALTRSPYSPGAMQSTGMPGSP